MASTDFEHDALADQYRHPDTDVVINGEDMPQELKPSDPWILGQLFPDDRRYVPVPFDEIINWRLHPTRPVAPIAHRRK